jgi:hydroxymethylglutaryl-CoA synthase
MQRSLARNVGISAIEVYIPKLYVEIEELEAHHRAGKGKYTIGLGQKRMSVVTESEDSVSMGLTGNSEY